MRLYMHSLIDIHGLSLVLPLGRAMPPLPGAVTCYQDCSIRSTSSLSGTLRPECGIVPAHIANLLLFWTSSSPHNRPV